MWDPRCLTTLWAYTACTLYNGRNMCFPLTCRFPLILSFVVVVTRSIYRFSDNRSSFIHWTWPYNLSTVLRRFLINEEAAYIQSVPGGRVSIPGGHSIGHPKQKVYMYMCPIPNGFPDRAISLYSTDEQHAMSSDELQSALMLAMEFSEMCYTRQTVPILSREQ
jgi:hypothetical protein